MSLSNTSLGFLRELHTAIQNVEVDGVRPSFDLHTFLVGNGGSASVAGHISNDLVKAGKRATSLSEPAILTCLSNDLGYENVYLHQLQVWGRNEDTLIAISSSGRSENILRATQYARGKGLSIITCTGFDADNPLRALGDYNIWVPSANYGVVEVAHLSILHSLVKP